jgi:hypothetical protein
MAITTRYFSTTAATWVTGTAYVVGDYVLGTDSKNWRCILNHTSAAADRPITGANYATYWEECDGTTWDKRAALLVSGNWSAVITGFNFTSDSLVCYIGPGTYTCSQTLNNTTITTDPTAANPLMLHGCDSSGVALEPSNPLWTSDTVPTWDSGLPVIDSTTNVQTINQDWIQLRLLKFTASGRNGAIVSTASAMEWVYMVNSTSNSSSGCHSFSLGTAISNCYFSCTGSSYSYIVTAGNNGNFILANCALIGVIGTSGNRQGFIASQFAPTANLVRCTIANTYGAAITTSGQGAVDSIIQCVIFGKSGNNGSGVSITRSTSAGRAVFQGNMITGWAAYGATLITTSGAVFNRNRFRDNTSGNINNNGNYQDFGSYTTDTDDASEFVDAANNDFRIKNTATIWGDNFGVSEQPAASSAGGSFAFIG